MLPIEFSMVPCLKFSFNISLSRLISSVFLSILSKIKLYISLLSMELSFNIVKILSTNSMEKSPSCNEISSPLNLSSIFLYSLFNIYFFDNLFKSSLTLLLFSASINSYANFLAAFLCFCITTTLLVTCANNIISATLTINGKAHNSPIVILMLLSLIYCSILSSSIINEFSYTYFLAIS